MSRVSKSHADSPVSNYLVFVSALVCFMYGLQGLYQPPVASGAIVVGLIRVKAYFFTVSSFVVKPFFNDGLESISCIWQRALQLSKCRNESSFRSGWQYKVITFLFVIDCPKCKVLWKWARNRSMRDMRGTWNVLRDCFIIFCTAGLQPVIRYCPLIGHRNEGRLHSCLTFHCHIQFMETEIFVDNIVHGS